MRKKFIFQLSDSSTLHKSKFEKCDTILSEILLAIVMPNLKHIRLHLIPKIHVRSYHIRLNSTKPSLFNPFTLRTAKRGLMILKIFNQQQRFLEKI